MKILAFAASNNPQSINQQLALSVARLLPQAAAARRPDAASAGYAKQSRLIAAFKSSELSNRVPNKKLMISH